MNNIEIFRKLLFVTALSLTTSLVCTQHEESGKTTFPTSGTPGGQVAFLKGLLMLHCFQYDDAREAFQEAEQIDPSFAMAYWGEAMTHNQPIWMMQDLEAAREVLKKLGPTPEPRIAKAPTEREKDYLRTLDILFGEGDKKERDLKYAAAMGELSAKYPWDLDAAAFHALAILGTSHEGRDFATYMKAAAIVEQVFDKNPQHPGAAHYLIHSYDDPIHAPLGLRPARVFAKIAPTASHALHMPAHIFFALGMWDEAAKSNEDAYAAAKSRSERKNTLLSIHGTHSLNWLAYTYLQQGRYAETQKPLRILGEHVKQSNEGQYWWHRTWAAYLIDTEYWQSEFVTQALDTSSMTAIDLTDYLFVKGLAAFKTGNQVTANQELEKIKALAIPSEDPLAVKRAEVIRHELEALIRLREGKEDEAIDLMKRAVAIEDAMPLEFGPPRIIKPSHELFGEILLEVNQPVEAMEQFRLALSRDPRRARSLLGLARAAVAAKEDKIARQTYLELYAMWRNADKELSVFKEVKQMRDIFGAGTN